MDSYSASLSAVALIGYCMNENMTLNHSHKSLHELSYLIVKFQCKSNYSSSKLICNGRCVGPPSCKIHPSRCHSCNYLTYARRIGSLSIDELLCCGNSSTGQDLPGFLIVTRCSNNTIRSTIPVINRKNTIARESLISKTTLIS